LNLSRRRPKNHHCDKDYDVFSAFAEQVNSVLDHNRKHTHGFF